MEKRSKWEEERMGGEERTHSGWVEEVDGFMVTEAGESSSDELRVGDQQQDGGMKLGSGQDGEAGSEDEEVEVEEHSGEEEIQRELEVWLCPVERSGGQGARISLEEVQRYSRFCRCCHWLCGTCLIISPSQSSSFYDVFLSAWLSYSMIGG